MSDRFGCETGNEDVQECIDKRWENEEKRNRSKKKEEDNMIEIMKNEDTVRKTTKHDNHLFWDLFGEKW